MQPPNPTPIPPVARLLPSDVQVLPDPTRRWLASQKPEGYQGWWPATGAQEAALNSDADLLLLGGAAGSLKTSTMLVDLIQERELPTMRSYFFRRTYKELEGGGSAIDQAYQIFPQTGATYNASSHTWKWPSGAEFYFRHCQYEKDVYQYQSQAMSAGAIDESTHWMEKEVRYLITRNRSTDPGITVRWRLGTNPGNIGHSWHMKMFFNGVCPHCEPHKAPAQNALRWDARWASDNAPLSDASVGGHKLSVSYILSYVRDHDLLGGQYIARLKMQSANTAKALLEGCWKIFEGQYFDIWNYDQMTIGRKEIGEQWWWHRWIGCDYGFSISAPAALLLIQSPPTAEKPYGIIFIADEMGGHDFEHKASEPFARAIAERWVTGKDSQGRTFMQERRWQPWYLSPDAFADRGGQFTLAGQMNDVLNPYGLYFQKARDDRAGGWMKMYNALRDGELVICRECTKTIEAIESRVHDPDHENDILKVRGDESDDVCDGLRYGYYSWATAQESNLPAKERFNQTMQAAWQRDPTAAMVRYPDMMKELQQDGQPAVYSGNARARLRQHQTQKRYP